MKTGQEVWVYESPFNPVKGEITSVTKRGFRVKTAHYIRDKVYFSREIYELTDKDRLIEKLLLDAKFLNQYATILKKEKK